MFFEKENKIRLKEYLKRKLRALQLPQMTSMTGKLPRRKPFKTNEHIIKLLRVFIYIHS